MTDLLGTNVASTVVPFTDQDDYATHDEKYGAGGWRTVADMAALAALPVKRLRDGMAVLVRSNNFIYTYNSSSGNFVYFTSLDAFVTSIGYSTWADLKARDLTDLNDGAIARVVGDSGTHLDDVTGLSVANEGVYRLSKSTSKWPRLANLETFDITTANQLLNQIMYKVGNQYTFANGNLYFADPNGFVLFSVVNGDVVDSLGQDLSTLPSIIAALNVPKVYKNIGGQLNTGQPTVVDVDPNGMVADADVPQIIAGTLSAEQTRMSNVPASISITALFVGNSEISANRVSSFSGWFRIPAGARASGVDHAFCEARHNSSADSGYVGIAWASRENGAWGDSQLLIDEANWRYHNPCPIADPITGDLHLLFSSVSASYDETNEPSLTSDPTNCGRVYSIVYRNGQWRHPITNTALTLPITRAQAQEVIMGRDPSWQLFYTGPGAGIAMSNGMLAAPGWGGAGLTTAGGQRSFVFRYDRMSRMWSAGAPVPIPGPMTETNEPTLAEDDWGNLIINCRFSTGTVNGVNVGYGRVLAYSRDMGRTWLSSHVDRTYKSPAVAESMLRTSSRGDGQRGRGLYYNVEDTLRQNGTIRYTLNGFDTYSIARKLFATLTENVTTDFEGVTVPSVSITHYTAYGSLWNTGPETYGLLIETSVVKKDGTVSSMNGANSESYRVISFIEFNLSWVLGGS